MKFFKKIIDNIVKPFKRLYYNYSWGLRLYEESKKLDILLIYLDNVKITSIEYLNYDYKITFDDNSILTFWNSNRWYAWMVIGNMVFSNGKKIEWRYETPSYEVLYKYRKLILNQEEINKKEEVKEIKKEKKFKKIEDFYEYLPIKLLRKEKLKKIKKQ